jgi:hypothetical protein
MFWAMIYFFHTVLEDSVFTRLFRNGIQMDLKAVIDKMWAAWNKVKIKKFPANWDLYGKAAGHLRNKEMALYADGLIAFMINNSKGTSNMIKQAKENKLWIEIVEK